MLTSSRLSFIVVLAVSLSVLAGCGRRGPLEPPPKSVAPAQNTLAEDPVDDVDDPALISPSPNPTGRASRIIQPPKKPFILDPLL